MTRWAILRSPTSCCLVRTSWDGGAAKLASSLAAASARVRLLLDDINTSGLDETLAVLEAHPNIELRLYNPLVYRDWRMVNYLADFTRVNHGRAYYSQLDRLGSFVLVDYVRNRRGPIR